MLPFSSVLDAEFTPEIGAETAPSSCGIPLSGFVPTPQCFLAFLTAIAIAAAVDAVMITHNHRPETWQLTAEMVFDDGSSIIAWSLPATWPIPGP